MRKDVGLLCKFAKDVGAGGEIGVAVPIGPLRLRGILHELRANANEVLFQTLQVLLGCFGIRIWKQRKNQETRFR